MLLATTKTKVHNEYSKMNVCIVGMPKVGKSTFASQLGDDDVYFAATEKGHDFLEVYKSDIRSWKDFTDLTNDLVMTKHKFKHLVIDVVDKLYDFACDHICTVNKVKAISDIPFGGGYTAVKKMILAECEKLNWAAKMGITFVTHEKTKEVKKDNIAWTAAGTSLPNAIENTILGMCDLILFAHVDKNNNRVIRTKPTKFVIAAGDRSGRLPEVMPLDAKLLLKHLKGETK